MSPKKLKSYKPKKTTGIKKFQRSKEFKTPSQGYKHWYDTSEWKRYCYRFRHHNPRCYACGKESREVDHIQAHKGDPKLFWCETNYIALCKSCHSTCTSRFDRFNPAKTEEKLSWLKRTREIRGLTHKVMVVPFKPGGIPSGVF